MKIPADATWQVMHIAAIYGAFTVEYVSIIFDHYRFLSNPTKSLNRHFGLSGSMLSKLEELGVWAAAVFRRARLLQVYSKGRVLLKKDELFALRCTIGEVNTNPDGRARRSIQN